MLARAWSTSTNDRVRRLSVRVVAADARARGRIHRDLVPRPARARFSAQGCDPGQRSVSRLRAGMGRRAVDRRARTGDVSLERSRPIRALFLAAADREPRSGDSARLVPARRGAWSRSRDAGGNSRRSPLVEAVVVGIGRITERTAPGCTGAFVARPAAVAQRRAGALSPWLERFAAT